MRPDKKPGGGAEYCSGNRVQGNTSNIVFLKSTDDSMIETLQKMSGTTHQSYIDQKTVTRDMEKLFMANEGKASYMMSTKEVPVINYNDMAFIPERNSIVFRAGDAPIWNRNETILPMSWRLFQNTIEKPGTKFSLQTIPTLSSAVDFDIKRNQPDFNVMLETRMEQAALVEAAEKAFRDAFQYDDADIHRLDVDVYAADVMDMVSAQMARDRARPEERYADDDDAWYEAQDNEEQMAEISRRQADQDVRARKIYAHNQISRADLVNAAGKVVGRNLEVEFAHVYQELKGDFAMCPLFQIHEDGSVWSADGQELYIRQYSKADLEELQALAQQEDSKVYSEGDITEDAVEELVSYEFKDAFYHFLVNLDSWAPICNGKFEEAMTRRMAGE